MTSKSIIYFDEDILTALQLKASATKRSVSDIVNEAVGNVLAEDAADLAVFQERANEPARSFAAVVKDLRRGGKL